jgi:hypothetical protein
MKDTPHLRLTAEQVRDRWLTGKVYKPAGYLLDLLRAMRQDGWPLKFNVKDFCAMWGLNERSFFRAKAELVQLNLVSEKIHGEIELTVLKKAASFVSETDSFVSETDSFVSETDSFVSKVLLSSAQGEELSACGKLFSEPTDLLQIYTDLSQIGDENFDLIKECKKDENGSQSPIEQIYSETIHSKPTKRIDSETIHSKPTKKIDSEAIHPKSKGEGIDRPPKQNALDRVDLPPPGREREILDFIVRTTRSRGITLQFPEAYALKCWRQDREYWLSAWGALRNSSSRESDLDEWRQECAIKQAIAAKDLKFARSKFALLRSQGHDEFCDRLVKKYGAAIA